MNAWCNCVKLVEILEECAEQNWLSCKHEKLSYEKWLILMMFQEKIKKSTVQNWIQSQEHFYEILIMSASR